MDNSTFEAKIAVLNQTQNEVWDGILKLIRKHTAERQTETVGGWWRPFDTERDLGCFQCVFGQNHPFWDELWPYLERYGLKENFRNNIFAEMWNGCQDGRTFGKEKFRYALRMPLWDVIRQKT